MKNVYKYLFIFFIALFLQSCIADKPASKRKITSTASTTSSPNDPKFSKDDAIYWFTSEKIKGTLTINKNSDNIVYLRGSVVHNFLQSIDSSNNLPYYQSANAFCLIGNFGASNKQLRLRAVPIYTTNYSTRAIERYFRIDVPNLQENFSACGELANNPSNIQDPKNPNSGLTVDSVPISNATFHLPGICTNCLTTTETTSISLKLFQRDLKNLTDSMIPVQATRFSLSSIALKIDFQSNSTSDSISCSTSLCEAKGFDCCIQGQCVKDATLKSSAKSDMDYNQAVSEYNSNPLSFLNWPNIFNICSNVAHIPPPTIIPNPTTPLDTAQKRVEKYLEDYECIEQVQKSDGTLTSKCLPNKTKADHAAIKKKLAIACGCPSEYDPDTMAIKCPDWGVKPIYKSSIEPTTIIDFYCYAPLPENPLGPITNLNVNVSSRSAPHRFYAKTSGLSYDILTKVPALTVQEGSDFFYLDEGNKSSPSNGSYNVNSILGRMNLSLSQTQPARMIDVELGKTYVVSATRGYFTPCSTCAKDSWFQSFSAHPSSSNGVGLRAIGFSTSRDTFSSNTTLGNYEDTHFGRACYVPVTMIPLSHKKETNLITQRQNRLTTQSAFYINGYQKDWFGFNKGALIGSFDGVTWFAIGTGRRITATATKLYLAINAPFLDLADRTDTVVNIIPDLSANIAANFDFDPTLSLSDSRQNSAGSCQQYHQCSTDTDCVTQLGWDYTCTDVSQSRTRWPLFDSDGKEIADQEKVGSIFEILSDTTTIGNSTKRCVYRGAGSPCVRDFSVLSGSINKKSLTCAPNFYCASLTSNKFNDELARSPNETDNILFGMDTNVLGRPLNYVTATQSLLPDIINNIKNNGATGGLGLTASQVLDMGICRPGKSLSASAVVAHSNPDPAQRTDYINQIASCDTNLIGIDRTRSCPAFGQDMNYLPYDTLGAIKVSQNSCGAESKQVLNSVTTSAFKNIEGGPLASLNIISTPIFAADACLRRAGSVCHTDLDCGPNKLHEEAAGSLSLSFFGGTEAEQKYWTESLVCGQGSPRPTLGSADYARYKLSENRCCREVGKDFTMFTSGPNTIIPENGLVNAGLKTEQFSHLDPKANNRYSRYSVSPTALFSASSIPSIKLNTTPPADQWRVINETGYLTCCGGGWIRKFADGTHDWKIKNRLKLDSSNFSCLNFRSPLISIETVSFGDSSEDKVVAATYQSEDNLFCKSPGQGGCLQIPFGKIEGYSVTPPTIYEPSASANFPYDNGSVPLAGLTRLDTMPVGNLQSGDYTFRLNNDVPYQPTAFTFAGPYDLYLFPDGTKRSLPFMINQETDYGLHIYLPAYIPYLSGCATAGMACLPTVSSIRIKYQTETGEEAIYPVTAQNDKTICNSIAKYNGAGQPIDSLAEESWCVSSSAATQNRPMLSLRARSAPDWKLASVVIDFKPIELSRPTPLVTTIPGNPYYYLTKLGRLELTGIPQITYEPLYCSSDNNKLVPGIFNSKIKNRADFNTVSFTNSYKTNQSYDEDGTTSLSDLIGNPNDKVTFLNNLAHSPVFSSKDFACCTPLGMTTTSGSKCCSGTASNVNGVMTCKIPTGTDLHVYFNKFVSSEGVGENEPLGGLIVTGTNQEVDFNQYTGEPKMRVSTYSKIEELGKAHCINGIVGNGGAFGQFPPEPYSGSYSTPAGVELNFPVSIVDSIFDFEVDNDNVGKVPFDIGFRWDHHYYCK